MTILPVLLLLLAPLQTPAAPTVNLRTCAVLSVATPPSAGRWKVQWFDGAVSITGNSTTYRRTLTLRPGTHTISLRWTLSGQVLTSATVTRVCTLVP